MATHRLYYDDSFLRDFSARVLSCSAVAPIPTAAGPQPVWEVLLDRTAFYPSSGGQPNDLGCLGGVRVFDVRDDGEDIAHVVDRELPPGMIEGHIDWPRRFDHMQQHTGQHLLSAVLQERYGLPTVSFHLGSDLCTIDVRGPEPTADTLEGAQRAANAAVFEDRPVNVCYGTAEQLAQRGVRKKVDREGMLRAIEIDGADLQPCGGTHVKSTAQVGMVLVRRCTKMRQDWRLEFACGSRAERLASADFQLLRGISERLSCSPEELPAAIEKSANERDASFKNLRTTLQQFARDRAKLLYAAGEPIGDGGCCVATLLREENAELLLPLATELAKKEKTVALVLHEPTGQLVFAQSTGGPKDLSALLRQLLATIAGKGGGTRDFVRAKLADPSQSGAALDLARHMAAAA